LAPVHWILIGKKTTPMTKFKVGECSRMDGKYLIETNGVIGTLLELLFFIITNFGQKIPILDRPKKNLLVILDKSFCDWAMHFLTRPRLPFLISHFN
jgi:hypothetical protein